MAYTPRLTAPAQTDPLWVMVEAGGYNGCIAGWWPGGYSAYPCVLPNCTGYVHGRAMEIAGVTSDNLGLSFGNAYDYWSQTSADWIRESEPSLGAIGVFAVPEMGRFYRHVLVQKNYPHHAAITFHHNGRLLYDVFKYLGVKFDEIDYNQPAGVRYRSENPFPKV